MLPEITDHRDGFALNDRISIARDERDAATGGSYRYSFTHADAGCVGQLQFQRGPLGAEGSIEGVTSAAVIAVVLDQLRAFQQGPFSCRENACAITKLEEAIMWIQKRARDRAQRGVLGTLQK